MTERDVWIGGLGLKYRRVIHSGRVSDLGVGDTRPIGHGTWDTGDSKMSTDTRIGVEVPTRYT